MPRQVVETVKGANGAELCRVYDDGTILLKDVRFSYPHTGKPWKKADTDNPLKYAIVGMLSKTTHKGVRALLLRKINAILAEHKLKAMAEKDLFLRDGDTSGKEHYDGVWTVNASSPENRPPSVRGRDARPIDRDKADQEIRGGFYGDILVKPWWQDNKHGKKINCDLIAVQVKRGRPEDEFGQGRVSEEDIDDTFDAADDYEDSGFDDDGADTSDEGTEIDDLDDL
jgi:hypothetical protein